jgi:hypothetical protein
MRCINFYYDTLNIVKKKLDIYIYTSIYQNNKLINKSIINTLQLGVHHFEFFYLIGTSNEWLPFGFVATCT